MKVMRMNARKCINHDGMVSLLVVAFLTVPSIVSCSKESLTTDIMCKLVSNETRVDPQAKQHLHGQDLMEEKLNKGKSKILLQTITGSSVPDCSWACGDCNPCTRVTINRKHFQTQSSQHSLVKSKQGNQHDRKISLLAHRCVCQGKSFPVP